MIFEPGFFSNSAVHSALLVGTVVAIVCGFVGTFTVIRGQSFTAESLSDSGAAGGSGAYLAGVSAMGGFIIAAVAAAIGIELVGARRAKGRDVVTGILVGFVMGLTALLLFFDTTHSSTTGAAITILFGSLFTLPSSTVPVAIALSGGTLVLFVLLYRRFLLSSLDEDLARANGLNPRLVGVEFAIALALSVALASVTIGAILALALIVGPSATALKLTKRPGTAVALSGLLGVFCVWLGILLSYDSYYWPPYEKGWPVSFLVVALIFTSYCIAHIGSLLVLRRRRHPITHVADCHVEA